MPFPTKTQAPTVMELNLSDQVFTFTDATGTEWHWNASKEIGRASCRERV